MTYWTDPNAFLTDLQFFGGALLILCCLLSLESVSEWVASGGRLHMPQWWVALRSGWTVWKRGGR